MERVRQNEAYRQRKFELVVINARIVHKFTGTPPNWKEYDRNKTSQFAA